MARKLISPLALALLIAIGPASSFSTAAPQVGGRPQIPQPIPPEDPAKIQMEKDRAKQFNKERAAALKRDTDKLVQLTGELKQYVDKSSENVLSVDVIKKAEEIEKLAHSVKEKMKGSY